MILDVFLGQTTDEVKETMAALHVTPIYILEGCTGYVQPLDTDINKMLKDKIGFFLDEILMENELGLTNNSGSQIGNRWVAVTHAVRKAWHWLHEEKRETIVRVFEHTGISLPPDESKDHKLNIRDLPSNFTIVRVERAALAGGLTEGIAGGIAGDAEEGAEEEDELEFFAI